MLLEMASGFAHLLRNAAPSVGSVFLPLQHQLSLLSPLYHSYVHVSPASKGRGLVLSFRATTSVHSSVS